MPDLNEWQDWQYRMRFGEPKDKPYPFYDLRWVVFVFWAVYKYYWFKWKEGRRTMFRSISILQVIILTIMFLVGAYVGVCSEYYIGPPDRGVMDNG